MLPAGSVDTCLFSLCDDTGGTGGSHGAVYLYSCFSDQAIM